MIVEWPRHDRPPSPAGRLALRSLRCLEPRPPVHPPVPVPIPSDHVPRRVRLRLPRNEPSSARQSIDRVTWISRHADRLPILVVLGRERDHLALVPLQPRRNLLGRHADRVVLLRPRSQEETVRIIIIRDRRPVLRLPSSRPPRHVVDLRVDRLPLENLVRLPRVAPELLELGGQLVQPLVLRPELVPERVLARIGHRLLLRLPLRLEPRLLLLVHHPHALVEPGDHLPVRLELRC